MAMNSELNITHVQCQARVMEARFHHSVFADCRIRYRLLHINVRMNPEPLVTFIEWEHACEKGATKAENIRGQ